MTLHSMYTRKNTKASEVKMGSLFVKKEKKSILYKFSKKTKTKQNTQVPSFPSTRHFLLQKYSWAEKNRKILGHKKYKVHVWNSLLKKKTKQTSIDQMNCLYKQRETTNLKSSVTILKTLSFPDFNENHNKNKMVTKTKQNPAKYRGTFWSISIKDICSNNTLKDSERALVFHCTEFLSYIITLGSS